MLPLPLVDHILVLVVWKLLLMKSVSSLMQRNARYGLMSQVDLIFPLVSLDVFTAAACVSVWALEILALNINFSAGC